VIPRPSRHGPVRDGDGVRFRLWGPSASEVLLLRPDADPVPMRRNADDFFETTVPARPGDLYRFHADGLDVPDPASRGQAGDVDGWSRLRLDPLGPTRPRAIRPWHEKILCELHVGTVTPEGTFRALEAKLPHFRDAGYTAIELLPVNDFPGRWNWGYDGVLPFAPDESYGRPDELRALVDAAHGLGLGVMLDVVYNHFGPQGNYLHHYAEAFFTEKHGTPWGAAIDLSNPIVRAFFVENAAMWLRDYDFDGLRFDAVHAFPHPDGDALLGEIAEACRAIKPDAWLVLENDDNAARWLVRESGAPRYYAAQWNDDIHHAIHVTATGEIAGYYEDYAENPVRALLRCLVQGFAYQGETSPHRREPRGEPSGDLPPEAFVAFCQNHDQIGNRPFGDRLASMIDPGRLHLAQALVMLSPQIPMFFMGEEAALETPFPFFCDWEGELADAVRRGRRREFAGFFESHAGSVDDLPDPLAESTVAMARLPWDRLTSEATARFRALSDLRQRLIWPLAASGHSSTRGRRDGDALSVEWRYKAGTLTLSANFGDGDATFDHAAGQPAHTIGSVQIEGGRATLGPWSLAFWSTA
jgi:maltooligosyltrehalose trehalohydrolase